MSASAAPRLTAVVLFPTPPFWFAIAMIRARPGVSGTTGRFFREDRFALVAEAADLRGEVTAAVAEDRDALGDALLTVGS
jgi:hypothetical protein